MDDDRAQATGVLEAHVSGDGAAAERLLPLIYDKLRALAHQYMKNEGGYQTLDPTGLVHEAYLRMIQINRIDWQGKSHFFAMAARQMRRILVERARAAAAEKRGGGRHRVTLRDDAAVSELAVDLIALDQGLDRLEQESPRQYRVAELRLFAGMLEKEIAHILGVTDRTVRSDWRVARAWLSAELESSALKMT